MSLPRVFSLAQTLEGALHELRQYVETFFIGARFTPLPDKSNRSTGLARCLAIVSSFYSLESMSCAAENSISNSPFPGIS